MWRDLGISEQEWDSTPQAVRTVVLALQQQVRLMGIRFTAYEKQLAALREQVATVGDLKAEIAELRERLGQDSSNSSKPPSSDPPSYERQPPREPKGRKRGGRPGHQGSARCLLPADEVDRLVELKPAACVGCGRKLRGSDPHPERRQVSEAPPVRAEVTEYRRHALPFVRVEGVEPTNNAAERALRWAVLWRRKSFGTQSASGSRFVGRVLTAVASLRQQGRDVLAYLAGVCRSALDGGAQERLTPILSALPT